MIKQPTVFVLGAGASYPYGFPTGDGLVDEIIELTQQDPPNNIFLANGCSTDDVRCFGLDLASSHASSVDAFLEHRPDFLKIGKLAIAMALIPKERDQPLSRSYRRGSHEKAKMTWYHYLWDQMSSPKRQLAGNRVSFVTLNYDRSLERYLFSCLKAQHGYREDKECLDELYGLQFVHMYGSLGDDRFEEDPFDRIEPSPLEVQRAADRLRIIHEETLQAEYILQAVELLHDAEVVCFLGYGFHNLNNRRLQLIKMARDDNLSQQKWFASRYNLTEVEFRRRTSQFFNRFMHSGYIKGRVGDESDGALEVLRKLPVIA